MNPKEIIELRNRIEETATKRVHALDALVPAARAAANQMKDAGMLNGAEALNRVLFEVEALTDELNGLLDKVRGSLPEILKELMKWPG